MLTDANRNISVIAYYLSTFDKDAVHALSYDTYSGAFTDISARFGKANNYMKLRRNEFAALVVMLISVKCLMIFKIMQIYRIDSTIHHK